MPNLQTKALTNAMLMKANERGWTSTLEPKLLRHRDYRSGSSETSGGMSQLLDEITSLFIDVYAVIIAPIGDEIEEHQSAGLKVLHYLEVSAKIRTWLNSALKENFYLFLVGPPGSLDSKEWRDVEYRIERDERICRKLVWLPPSDESLLDRDAHRFCERTFMARPWRDANTATEELDPLKMVLASAGLPLAWYEILDRRTLPEKDIANLLIAGIPDDVLGGTGGTK